MDQVAQYLGHINGSRSDAENALYVIMIGANDVLFDANVTGTQTVSTITKSIQKLDQLGESVLQLSRVVQCSWFCMHIGAKHFVVVSYPDLSKLPYSAYTTKSINEQLHNYSIQLRASLEALQSPHTIYVDVYQLFEDFFARPDQYGFDGTKLTKSCLTGAYSEAPRTVCDDPDRYIFWDEYHVRPSIIVLSQNYVA